MVKARLLLLLSVLFLLIATFCFAQGPLGQPTGRSGEEQLPLPEKPSAPPPHLEVPASLPPSQAPGTGAPITAFVRQIRIEGNTVFTDQQLAEVTRPYTNRGLSSEDMESLRMAITVFYINHGYINSGAVVPDQTIRGGVLTIRVIEGHLSRIDLEGNHLFTAGYFSKRIQTDKPLNINELQERLQILQQDERIATINANLKPGVTPGEAILDTRVREAPPFRAYLDFNNYNSPTVGAEALMLTLQHMSLTGHGDILSFGYGGSRGIDPRIESFYALPFNRYDGTVTFAYRKNDFAVIEDPFEDLDIDSKSDIYTIMIRQPVYRTMHNEIALGLTGEHLYNKTYLFDEPFSFYPGVKNGKSKVTALRGFQEWIYRSKRQFVALRSQLSLGIDALDATTNGHNLPDGRFFAWLLQGRWAFRHQPFDMQTFIRVDTQLTPDSLLPLEQISVGGRYTVRGYRENQLVRDNAFVASVEERFPLVRNKAWAGLLDLCAFYDFGHSWNTDLPSPNPRTLDSVGLGLRWELGRAFGSRLHPQFEFYWGLPLRNVDTEGGNLQDQGIHFRFLLMYW